MRMEALTQVRLCGLHWWDADCFHHAVQVASLNTRAKQVTTMAFNSMCTKTTSNSKSGSSSSSSSSTQYNEDSDVSYASHMTHQLASQRVIVLKQCLQNGMSHNTMYCSRGFTCCAQQASAGNSREAFGLPLCTHALSHLQCARAELAGSSARAMAASPAVHATQTSSASNTRSLPRCACASSRGLMAAGWRPQAACRTPRAPPRALVCTAFVRHE